MDADFEILASGFQFVEAPRGGTQGEIDFSDLLGGGFYRYRPGEGVRCLLPGRRWIGGAVPAAHGRRLISGEGGIVRLDPATGRTEPVLTAVGGEAVNAINDMEADARGGLFAGTVDFQSILVDQMPPTPGKFFHLSADGEVTILRDDLHASNGMGFSPDGRTLFHSETKRGVWRYALDDRGLPADQKLLVALDDSDGLVVDARGDIRVACWDQAVILHFGPDGEAKGSLSLPFTNVISLDYTGADLRDLIVSVGGTMAGSDEPAGGIIRLRSEIPGQRAYVAAI